MVLAKRTSKDSFWKDKKNHLAPSQQSSPKLLQSQGEKGTWEAVETFPGLVVTHVATGSCYQRETFVQSSFLDSSCVKHFVKPEKGQILSVITGHAQRAFDV